ncbi:sulfotransferase family 2 domain-containing protein [Okeania sp.]|uniref:sulfotransferase family 2 domain-containing protein n=1 Tax=Okeania sp. TaxID=3100323 RepID=UPI002B4B0839|nr:sulfotransferase family 2 domain-containing protein [Okeania sp.]MEB3341290.1 sulfotransferase family 2 domain-containing protein [Okeania sp.]
MERKILIHHHIFKNAGTSLQYALKKFFGESYYECELPQSQMVTKDDLEKFILNNPSALAISGHHICLPTPQGQQYQTFSIILLRNPLARVESIYKFEKRQKAQTQGAIKAKELNFQEYVKWRLNQTPTMFCNYQTYYCSRQNKSEGSKIPKDRDLKLAIENLQSSAVVGIVERYKETLELANQVLSENFPGIHLEYTYLNATSAQNSIKEETQIKNKLEADLGSEIVKQLEEGNALDKKLWKVADKMITDKLKK